MYVSYSENWEISLWEVTKIVRIEKFSLWELRILVWELRNFIVRIEKLSLRELRNLILTIVRIEKSLCENWEIFSENWEI